MKAMLDQRASLEYPQLLAEAQTKSAILATLAKGGAPDYLSGIETWKMETI